MASRLPCFHASGFRCWADRSVALGHLAHAGSGPATPATDLTGRVVATGDVRLDNRVELARELGIRAGPHTSDVELVLAAYQRWGAECPARLDGDFSFALWDGGRRLLLCARDAIGARPLYYSTSGDGFAIASDPRALLALPGLAPHLNPVAIVDYLFAFYEDKVSTPYRDVVRLPPGHVVLVREDGPRVWRWWRPESVPEARLGSDGACEEAFRDAFTSAVRSRLTGRALGVYLSGGLDSSSITCVAQPLYGGGPLAAFSAVYDEERRSDERSFAALAAAQAGADHHLVRPEHTSPLADWEGAPWTWPGPGSDPQAAVCRVVTEGAREHGVSTLLSGFGGDSVVSFGAPYLTELVGSGRPVRFLREVRAVQRHHGRPPWHLVRTYGLAPFVPPVVMRARRSMQPHRSTETAAYAPVRRSVVRELGFEDRVAELGPRHRPRTARQAHLDQLRSGAVAYALEGSYHTDVVVGVERRYPFLDRRLAELCLSLPGDQKLRDGWTRSILRRSMAGILPEEVRLRPDKGDLTHGFRRGLLGADRPLVESIVARPGAVAEWVEPAALAALWDRCLTDSRTLDWYALWRVVVLALWLKHNGLDA